MTFEFTDWSEAFDFCREKGSPVRVLVGAVCRKIFPSGSCATAQATSLHRWSGRAKQWEPVDGRLFNRSKGRARE